MSDTFCNHIQKGLFVSHEGVGLCCWSKRYTNVSPLDFWNGEIRQKALKQMHDNLPVDGCNRCYKTEKKNVPSSRTFAKSYDGLPAKDLPTMLDLDFSNFCNLKCVMCYPSRSSEWAKDLGLPVSKINYSMIDELVSISNHVRQITIQGGEPSIMPEYEYFFQKLEEKGYASDIDLQIITNVTNVNRKFYDLIATFKTVRLSVSVDAYGTANDYIRWPSKFKQITKNIHSISNMPGNIQVDILSSLNILSMFDYHKFLKWCGDLEKIFDLTGKKIRMVPMKVQEPKQFSPFSAPRRLKDKFVDDVKLFTTENPLKHNSNWKLEMMLLCRSIQQSPEDTHAISVLKDEVKELDAKRKVDITNYIPNFHEYI
jgi:sulfatase maturation enzyme AslB (radical SAM superfamily)